MRSGGHLFTVTVGISLIVLFLPGPDVPTAPTGTDKVVHFTLFAALALTGRYARIPSWPLFAGLVVYAIVSEILQTVPLLHRDGSVWDASADVLGAAVGLLLYAAGGRFSGGRGRPGSWRGSRRPPSSTSDRSGSGTGRRRPSGSRRRHTT
jgi:peptidoglycan/LPS O-acetylase OafA/YrhL